MKKNLTFLLLLVIILFGCNNSEKNESKLVPTGIIKAGTDLAAEGLYSDVKELKQTKYRAMLVNGEIVKREIVDDWPVNFTLAFNDSGMILERKHFNSDGSLYSSLINKYDSFGNKIQTDEYRYGDNFKTKTIYKFDRKRNLIGEEEFWGNNLFSKSTYTYDDNDKKTASSRFMPEGYHGEKNFTYKEKMKYDVNGNLLSLKRLNTDGSLDYEWSYTYDAFGNVIEKKGNYSSKGLDFSDVYIYDKYGKIVEFNGYDGYKNLYAKEKYYANEKVKEHIQYLLGGAYLISKFDERGEEVERIKQSKDRIIQHSQFIREYDEFGNWVQEVEMDLLNDVPEYIAEREIIYY